jgi:hypothetical protein
MTGTLENPVDAWPPIGPDYRRVKCTTPSCNSKSFALLVPKDYDKYYQSLQKGEERSIMLPKLFRGPSDLGEYYCFVQLTCAKCGADLDEVTLFTPLGQWKPREQ